MTTEFLSTSQVAKMTGISRQGVYQCLKSGRLKSQKINGRWKVTLGDLRLYQKQKYSRDYSKDQNGKLLFCPSEGRYSPRQAAEALKISVQKVYYFIYSGKIKTIRTGGSHIILASDLETCKKILSMR